MIQCFHEVCYKGHGSIFKVLCNMCPFGLLKECLNRANNCGQLPFDMLVNATPSEARCFSELRLQKEGSATNSLLRIARVAVKNYRNIPNIKSLLIANRFLFFVCKHVLFSLKGNF